MKRYVMVVPLDGTFRPALFDGERALEIGVFCLNETAAELVCCALNQYDADRTLGELVRQEAREAELE